MVMVSFRQRLLRWLFFLGVLLVPLVSSAPHAFGQDEEPLPEDRIVVDIDAPDEEVFRIGIPNFIGEPSAHAVNGSAILQNDFRLMPGFRVIGPSAVRHDYESIGLGVDLEAWSALGANGVIKGLVGGNEAGLRVELRFYQSSGGEVPALSRRYHGPSSELRKWMHDFANAVIGVITGVYGPFSASVWW